MPLVAKHASVSMWAQHARRYSSGPRLIPGSGSPGAADRAILAGLPLVFWLE